MLPKDAAAALAGFGTQLPGWDASAVSELVQLWRGANSKNFRADHLEHFPEGTSTADIASWIHTKEPDLALDRENRTFSDLIVFVEIARRNPGSATQIGRLVLTITS
ncbi:hypothetical protein MMAG44476_27173 [Mycolicibacterium mageritense DSM 44476 = CIP 104973]|jgi:uncharacterized membrane protein YjdF|uniref:Type III secretion system translocation protein n=1 Tax=Mycolicibacterium canariasense TaxID=228230 RepID=A0A100WDW5_MYCCR|nr:MULTISPECIES: hypothetical protein [Mycolicibacterium]MCC9179440.1 hypothetical protein [Mycolicibacterium mageritense]ORU98637.1 hypothetical protein AWB94_28300 [Mycolicibacterium canariasense]GAS96779.1 type III secretion system translocation protein [Mycolicibacterium canariasense]